ncbi:MAG TPA: Flp family type IVb pilin [Sphingomicrobium sp.]|jgi:pilus assembly protein Flp/PilA
MVLGFSRIAGDKRGATAIEFALVASLIAVAAVTAFQSLGSNMNTMYSKVSNDL